jgi:hypothetical protein
VKVAQEKTDRLRSIPAKFWFCSAYCDHQLECLEQRIISGGTFYDSDMLNPCLL